MKTAHVLEQLALWVEGDLTESEASAVQAHLNLCPACSSAAERLRESQTWLKKADPSPFSPEDRCQLRQKVMASIQADPSRKRRGAVLFLKVRPLLLMAAALGLILVMKAFPRHHLQPLQPLVIATGNVLPQPLRPEPMTDPSPPARIVHPRAMRPGSSARPIEDPSPVESALARIEFQTTNPQIRIIWLARAERTPAEPHPSTDRLGDSL